MAAAPRTLFVTSALPYASGDIHFGHLLEHIQTDIWVRFQRLQGHRVLYCCADDSHGTPMMLTAERLGEAPETLVERYRRSHAEDLAAFYVDHDIYYTTHSEENRQCAELIFERCRDAGLIFTREVSQYFDPEKGMFLADRFLKGTCPRCGADDQYGDNCEKCGATYEATELKAPRSTLSEATPELRSSEHYFFDLGKQQAFLEQWTQSGTLQPEVANKIQEWLAAGLKPWDISRDAPYFGFKIPGSDNKYFYVWLDAPIGYMAALKKLEAEGRSDGVCFDAIWSASSAAEVHHFIGKDIVNFHTLFWPAMLEGAGFRTPTRIHTHGFLTVDGTKMSKSRGTFINASTYRAHLDPEYLRYYFAAKLGPNTDDIDLSLDDFVARVNADLVGKVVNIASRCAGFLHKQHGGQLGTRIDDEALWAEAQAALAPIASAYEAGEYGKAIRAIMALADRANQYIDAQKPWVLAKDPEQGEAVQAICTLGLNLFRVLVITLKPVLPKMAEAAEAFLGGASLRWADAEQWFGGQAIEPFKPLKTRLERSAVDAMVEASKESAPPAPPPAAPEAGETIDIAQFQALDLRAAKVLNAETVEGADKLLRLTLDVGPLGQRTVLSGIRSAYGPEELKGRFVVLLANLAPRKMRFGVSEGMVLAAGPGGEDLFLLSVDRGVTPGMEIA